MFQIVNHLIECGADVDIADNRGATPLHRSASKGNTETVKLLLGADCNVNARDSYGNTPL